MSATQPAVESRRQATPSPTSKRTKRGVSLAFVGYVIVLAVGFIVFLPAGTAEFVDRPVEGLVWLAFVAGAGLLTVPIVSGRLKMDVSLGAPVTIASAVLLSPAFALLVNALGLVNQRELRREVPILSSLFNRFQIGLSAAAAAAVAHLPLFEGAGLVGTLFATLCAVVVHNAAQTVAISLFFLTRDHADFGQALRMSSAPIPHFATDLAFSSMLALLVVVVYEQVGVLGVALIGLPLWLGYSAFRSARIAEDRAEELAGQVEELQAVNTAAEQLMSSRSGPHTAIVARGALREALRTGDLDVSLDGRVPDGLEAVPIPGAEPAVLGVPPDLSPRSRALVEAVGGLVGMTLTRQELEQELAEVQRARAALSSQIIEEGTRERSRLALELHDDVLPGLASAQINADNVMSSLAARDVKRADGLATASRDALHRAIASLRQVLDSVRRQIIVPGSLRPGLESALADLRLQHGVNGNLVWPNSAPEIPFAIEILFLDAVRGCLANIALHADAATVQVELCVTEKTIDLEVRDDGCGFDPTTVPEGHHGLALIAQRVELTRGRFTVNSAVGEGTQVRMEVPL